LHWPKINSKAWKGDDKKGQKIGAPIVAVFPQMRHRYKNKNKKLEGIKRLTSEWNNAINSALTEFLII
jgi:hypothetical protein